MASLKFAGALGGATKGLASYLSAEAQAEREYALEQLKARNARDLEQFKIDNREPDWKPVTDVELDNYGQRIETTIGYMDPKSGKVQYIPGRDDEGAPEAIGTPQFQSAEEAMEAARSRYPQVDEATLRERLQATYPELFQDAGSPQAGAAPSEDDGPGWFSKMADRAGSNVDAFLANIDRLGEQQAPASGQAETDMRGRTDPASAKFSGPPQGDYSLAGEKAKRAATSEAAQAIQAREDQAISDAAMTKEAADAVQAYEDDQLLAAQKDQARQARMAGRQAASQEELITQFLTLRQAGFPLSEMPAEVLSAYASTLPADHPALAEIQSALQGNTVAQR